LESQKNLGVIYKIGMGVEVDLAKAQYWFGLAGKQGDQDAMRAFLELNKGGGQ